MLRGRNVNVVQGRGLGTVFVISGAVLLRGAKGRGLLISRSETSFSSSSLASSIGSFVVTRGSEIGCNIMHKRLNRSDEKAVDYHDDQEIK